MAHSMSAYPRKREELAAILPRPKLADRLCNLSTVAALLRPARCSAIIFLKCATVISNAALTRRSPTIGSPSICETATAINSRQRDTLSGG